MKKKNYILCVIAILVSLPVLTIVIFRVEDMRRARLYVTNHRQCDKAVADHGMSPMTAHLLATDEVYASRWSSVCAPYLGGPLPIEMACEHIGYLVTQCEAPRGQNYPACNAHIWDTCNALFPTDAWYDQ